MTTRTRSLLTDLDLHLFNEGTHAHLSSKLGAHPMEVDGVAGTQFAVWAPNARAVSVVCDSNRWEPDARPLGPRASSGIWEGFIPGITRGERYKFHIVSNAGGYTVHKADPFASHAEVPPRTASVVWDLAYEWSDGEWMRDRAARNAVTAPISVYELHLGSWMRTLDGRPLNYRDLAVRLAEHCRSTGFTHVELLPIMEHPFDGSWGYQSLGYFAPTSRFGTPQDFMWFVDHMHQCGIGVILDWVPSHFATDKHGLGFFDGTHLYEHEDRRLGYHPDWGSWIFNFGRHEVRSFLLSSAMHWLDAYHADGLRVDAVASVLYLDYSRKAGEWIPNQYGGNENLEAISFLRDLNESVYREHPDVQTFAEESTAWPMVSRPVYVGGLGFGFKWDMGWMHDTLDYLQREPIHRRFHHDRLTFRGLYMFSESYVLPLSHDEVVHGKRSLLGKLPGDAWQQFANLRLLYGYMWAQPGKKLLFMGGEFGQGREWNHAQSLDWDELEIPQHEGVQRWVSDLNRVYAREPALHELDCDAAGFEWVDANDSDASVIAFLRRSRGGESVLVVCNFTPVVRHNYRIGVPSGGAWREIANSDADLYGGSNVGNGGLVEAGAVPLHGRGHSVALDLPPLGALFLKPA